jgi:hypothetical protein
MDNIGKMRDPVPPSLENKEKGIEAFSQLFLVFDIVDAWYLF